MSRLWSLQPRPSERLYSSAARSLRDDGSFYLSSRSVRRRKRQVGALRSAGGSVRRRVEGHWRRSGEENRRRQRGKSRTSGWRRQ